MSDAYRYSDPSVCYVLLITPPWAGTVAVSLRPTLPDAVTAARRRFACHGTGIRADGATIIEVGISENAPWYRPTGRMWWVSSDPCDGVHQISQGEDLPAGPGAALTAYLHPILDEYGTNPRRRS
jgi:hypothetical protein